MHHISDMLLDMQKMHDTETFTNTDLQSAARIVMPVKHNNNCCKYTRRYREGDHSTQDDGTQTCHVMYHCKKDYRDERLSQVSNQVSISRSKSTFGDVAGIHWSS